MNDYQARIARLQERMREERVGMAILAGTDQMTYLTGWREGGHERFVGLFVPAVGAPIFVVPAMNAPQARQTAAGIGDVRGWDDAAGWHAPAKTALTGAGAKIVVDDELLSVHLLAVQALFPAAKFEAIGPMMASLREIKTEGELAAMQRAADMIDTIFEESVAALGEGMRETDLQQFVLETCRRYGTSQSFTPLICFGANSALPHHHTGEDRLKRGDICVIDIGCTSQGYASDITRTVCFGPPSNQEAPEVYDIVYRAHHAARTAAKPGVSGETVDAAARSVITEGGYGERFVHRTGHGIGLSTHEPPYIVSGSTEPLRPGMCFSVEPGIYLPDRFGVRIENIVTMTPEGVRSLNAEPAGELRIVS